MDKSLKKIPPPLYTLIQTSIGGDPAIVVVNSALRNFKSRSALPWHLSLIIDCKLLGDKGMPTAEEVGILDQIEDDISLQLLAEQNVSFLARITGQGKRELLYRVHNPALANEVLREFTSLPSSLREWEYRMEHDETWGLAQPLLQLLERDPRIN